jgi:hypothetical protein
VRFRKIAWSLALAGLLTGCGGPPLRDVPRPATGLITNLDTEQLHLLTPTGERFAFRIESLLASDPDLDIAHLQQHLIQRLPVSITWRRAGDELVALNIEDAPVPEPPTPSAFPTGLPTFPPG